MGRRRVLRENRRGLRVKRYLGLVTVSLLLILVFLTTRGVAQQPAVYVANPGESFGPIKLGDYPPNGPRIICTSILGSQPGYVRIETYYLESGLRADTKDKERSPNKGQYSKVDSVNVVNYAFNLVIGPDGGCITNTGQVVTAATKVPVPQAVYVTNKGVQIGMTIEDVLEKHGPPVCSKTLSGADFRTTHMSYDGLELTFKKGHLAYISVSSYRPSEDLGKPDLRRMNEVLGCK